MKTLKIITITAIILIFAACGSNNNNTDKSTNIKVPEIDIHTAAFMEDIKAIGQHIEAGSDLDLREPTAGSTALISASLFGKTDAARALIEGGADINIQNNDGSTALHTAAFMGRIEIVKMLISKGADQSLQNNAGSTAYESVAGPFEAVKPIYDYFGNELGPLGLKLDYNELEKARPIIASLLK